MYLIPICTPIHTDGDRRLVTADWKRSLELLRDSFGGRFGEIIVLAPRLPVERAASAPPLVEVDPARDGIELIPSIPADVRARHYWTRHHMIWRETATNLVSRAAVVHAGADNLFKPVMTTAWRVAAEWNVPTVFVQDTDVVLQELELAGTDRVRRLRARVYGALYQNTVRDGVARSALSLLKGRDLVARYAAHGANVREFHDTSHLSQHVVSQSVVERRRERAARGEPLRLVYCGRFVERKGIATSIEWLSRARAAGAAIELDLFGDGEQRAALVELVARLGLREEVRFCGAVDYGPELIARLAQSDALLFTPHAEDTPRMIFDGYAAGLPLVATDINYVRERSDSERATILLPRNDEAAAVATLTQLARNRARLLDLGPNAIAAGHHHAADAWYARRAEWTIEAVERWRRGVA